jgi:hypothetical protein
MSGATADVNLIAAAAHSSSASYDLPSENQWYKAAFYKSGGTNAGYWLYSTQSNVPPSHVLSATGIFACIPPEGWTGNALSMTLQFFVAYPKA